MRHLLSVSDPYCASGGDGGGGKYSSGRESSSRSKKHRHGLPDPRYYSKREARRLQRSIEMIACLSELEEEDEENVFSLDELGEKSEQYCDAFQISSHMKKKAYRRCKHKPLNESFEAAKDEPRIFPKLFQPYPNVDPGKGKRTTLRLDSKSRVDLTHEEKESFLSAHDLSLNTTPSSIADVDADLVPQQSDLALCVPSSRKIFASSFKRMEAKELAVSKPLALPAPPRAQEVKRVVVVRRQPELYALPPPRPSPVKAGWIEQSKLYQKQGSKDKNMPSFRSLAQRLFG